MSNAVRVHTKTPVAVGTELKTVEVQSGAERRQQNLHQTAMSTVREFNAKDHGKNFKKVAKEFIATHKANIAKVEGLDSKELNDEGDNKK